MYLGFQETPAPARPFDPDIVWQGKGCSMFRKLTFLIVLISVSGCGREEAVNLPPPAATPATTTAALRTSYAEVVNRVSPAVVTIRTESRARAPRQFPFMDDPFFRRFFGGPLPPEPERLVRGLGSGVVVTNDGYILTNHHVIDGAQQIEVELQGTRTATAKLVGSDPPSDLAVLKIDEGGLSVLALADSDKVQVGDIVLAIGNPLGIGQSVTAGIISAKGRRTGLSDGSFEDFLQTDAPINRGNSGGALVNLSAELIGINSQILSSGGSSGGNIGIGFSIPSNMAKTVMEQLLKDGRVRRGMLGVNIQNITADTAQALDLKESSGVLVSNVRAGSAAEKAGVKRGDIITAINGEKIEDGNVLRNKVAGTAPGTEIRLTVLRDGNPQELTAVLDEFEQTGSGPALQQDPNAPAKEGPNGKLGLSLQPVTPQVARQL